MRILDAARAVLAENGYAKLSMRIVARHAGMAVGNLVYYYPSKRSLAHALILRLLEEYRMKSERLMRGSGHVSGMVGLIRYYIADSASRETSRLFRELWVMALHDSVVSSAMDLFYSELHKLAVDVLRRAQSALTHRQAADVVELMGTISEGANVLFASGRRGAQALARISRLAGRVLDSVAGSGVR